MSDYGTEVKVKVKAGFLRICPPVFGSRSTGGDLDGGGGREGTQEGEGGTRGQAAGTGGAQGTHVIPSTHMNNDFMKLEGRRGASWACGEWVVVI